ncbi:hypothetical protein [Pedobacter sp. SL55]|uniref:hypothetical protein n=1 Tax=Pedobacter sp. SL55 TaxID=2995161 RepID=UPI0022721B04|nr:hypothetical protein [Pedobacter sp. SL55]WAC40578.1 hypothetical protein OVA16_18735 [Pedobacter sp. SL55]
MQSFLDVVLWPAIFSFASGLGTWFLTRRKQKADVAASELDVVEKAITIWRRMAEDLGKQVEELRNEVHALRTENAKLLDELKKWKRQSKQNEN